MHETQIVVFFISMLTITNPLGNLAIFTGLTSDKTEREKNKAL